MSLRGLNVLCARNSLPDTLVTKLKLKRLESNIVEIFQNSSTDKNVSRELKEEFIITKMYNLKSYKPFFGKEVLVIIHLANLEDKDLFKCLELLLSNPDLILIFMNSSYEVYNMIQDTNNETIGSLNLYRPPDWLFNEHLAINISKYMNMTAVAEFKTRLRHQFNRMDDYVNILNTQPETSITVKEIKKYVPKYDPINFNKIMRTIYTGLDFDEAMETLYVYRSANSFTMKEVKKYTDELILCKKNNIQGNLNWKNVTEFSKENKLNPFRVKYILDCILPKSSLEIMYKIKHTIILQEKDIAIVLLLTHSYFYGGK